MKYLYCWKARQSESCFQSWNNLEDLKLLSHLAQNLDRGRARRSASTFKVLACASLDVLLSLTQEQYGWKGSRVGLIERTIQKVEAKWEDLTSHRIT